MRQYLLSICFCCVSLISINANDELFYVLYVKGQITLLTNNHPLQTGDELTGNPLFKYSSESDYAVLVSSIRGRMVLRAKSQTPNSKLQYYLNENLIPSKEFTGTRASSETNLTYLIFDYNNNLFLPKEISVSFSPADDDSYYLLSFSYDNLPLDYRLETTTQKTVKIIPNCFKKDGNNLDPLSITNLKLQFYNAEKEKVMSINGINLQVLQMAVLRNESETYKKALTNQKISSSEVKQSIIDYFLEVYGPLDQTLIDVLLK
jgi:hypothetical protein